MVDNEAERYLRQQDIVPPERLAQCRASVIGVGAIGRQVALQLTAMGVPRLQLIDFDTVYITNLATQGYLESDLNRFKVEATALMCRQLNSRLELEYIKQPFRRSSGTGDVVFCAVDRIESRRHIWDALKRDIRFWADGRMASEFVRVITAYDDTSRRHYPETLFHANEAFEGPCTAKSTIYTANIAAGFMISQFTKYLRQMPIDPDIRLNLLANELTI